MDTLSIADYRKVNGIYYTPDFVANEITKWAIRSVSDRIMDPSYGGCAFLSASLSRLRSFGHNNAGGNIYGVDIDPNAKVYMDQLVESGVPADNFILKDFLRLEKYDLPSMRVIIGNPPYVRHHVLTNESKEVALNAINNSGRKISKRASYWAYFLLHSLEFLSYGGRLAFILPIAFLQADYSREVKEQLLQSFREISIISIAERFFNDAEESCVLLLADGKGEENRSLKQLSISKVSELPYAISASRESTKHDVKVTDYFRGYQHSNVEVRMILEELTSKISGDLLSDLTEIRLGSVTGANKFFVIDKKTVEKWNIPKAVMVPIISHSSQLTSGLTVNDDHLNKLYDEGKAVKMIATKGKVLEQKIQNYITFGESNGFNKRYKCSKRDPWFRVNDFKPPAAFLTYMNWDLPRIILNEGKNIDCTNTIHRINWKSDVTNPEAVVLGFLSTLTQLTVELSGRVLGGGLLKIEPSHSKRIWIPRLSKITTSEFKEISTMVCKKQYEEARIQVDQKLMIEYGISNEEMDVLRDHLKEIKLRRMKKS